MLKTSNRDKKLALPWNWYESYAVQRIEDAFGISGVGLVSKIWCDAQIRGYGISWDEKSIELYSEDLGNQADEIVRFAVDRGLFCRKVFDEQAFLTNVWLQKEYLLRKKRFKEIRMSRVLFLLDKSYEEKYSQNLIID